MTEDCTIYQELYTACAIQAVFMQDNSSQSDPEREVLCYKNRAAVTPQVVAIPESSKNTYNRSVIQANLNNMLPHT